MTDFHGAEIEGRLYSVEGRGVVRMQGRYKTGIRELWSAITDPQRLALWYGKVDGDLRAGGEFTAFVAGSEWDGRGRIVACDQPHGFQLSKAEHDGPQEVVSVALTEEAEYSVLKIEVGTFPLDNVFAFGAGWQVLMEDLSDHLDGVTNEDWPGSWGTRWDELAPTYRTMMIEVLGN